MNFCTVRCTRMFVCLSLAFFSSAGGAQVSLTFKTGNDLKQACESAQSKNPLDYGYCWGYITAIVDVASGGPLPGGFKACVSTEATTGQLVAVIRKYLDEHPEYLHYNAASLVSAALKNAFPCKS